MHDIMLTLIYVSFMFVFFFFSVVFKSLKTAGYSCKIDQISFCLHFFLFVLLFFVLFSFLRKYSSVSKQTREILILRDFNIHIVPNNSVEPGTFCHYSKVLIQYITKTFWLCFACADVKRQG